MIATERDILRTLRQVFDQTAEHTTERDAVFLYKSANAIICTMLDAEEPSNNARVFYEKAERILEHVQQFVTFREHENWSEHSSYLYQFSESMIAN